MITKKKILVVFLLFFPLLTVNPALCQRPLKVGEVISSPGEIKSGFINVPAGSDGPEIQIPITVVNGNKKGPILALTAGIHGYEYPPILALQRLRQQLDPANMSGAVIMVHVVNIPSFLKRTIYYNPHDWKNQNRVFPGKIDGTMTERIAYQITNEVLKQCDNHLDLHCGDGNEDLMTYLYYHVQKGELLGFLTDLFGNVIQKAISPHDGIVMYIIATPPMSKGEPMVKIGGFQ